MTVAIAEATRTALRTAQKSRGAWPRGFCDERRLCGFHCRHANSGTGKWLHQHAAKSADKARKVWPRQRPAIKTRRCDYPSQVLIAVADGA
jgi:hypothetical protein